MLSCAEQVQIQQCKTHAYNIQVSELNLDDSSQNKPNETKHKQTETKTKAGLCLDIKTDFFHTWCYDRYYCILHFDTDGRPGSSFKVTVV